MVSSLVVRMNCTISTIAFTTPKPVLAGFAAPEWDRKIYFASIACKSHERIVFNELELPFVHHLFFGCFLHFFFSILLDFSFISPKTSFAKNVILTFATLEIDIVDV
jgi:hypothetical protein